MAIAFELVVDFGGDKQSADDCLKWLSARITPVTIDQYEIAIHPPQASGYPFGAPTRFQVSVIPANVGCAVALDVTDDRIPLNDFQLSRLGRSLYDVLRGAPCYELAMVGWDVDFLLDIDELNTDWTTEIQDGSFSGLVVRTNLISRLPKSSHFVPLMKNTCGYPILVPKHCSPANTA